MPRKEKHIVTVKLDPAKPRPLTRKQRAEIAALAKRPDRAIDYSDIPGFQRRSWSARFARVSIGPSNANSPFGSTRMFWRGSNPTERVTTAA